MPPLSSAIHERVLWRATCSLQTRIYTFDQRSAIILASESLRWPTSDWSVMKGITIEKGREVMATEMSNLLHPT
jgi:hypothetical protein